MRSQLPVIIVGAGPTGLLAANLLGQQNVPTIVIEEDLGLTTLPKAVLIDDTSLRAIQAIGLFDVFVKNIILGYGSRYLSSSGECFLEIGYENSEQGFPRRNAFSQPELERVLYDGLARFDCVQVHMNTQFTRLEQDEEKVVIYCKDETGRSVEFVGCVLLAADGGRSTIRKQLGVKMEGPAKEQDWLVIDVQNDADHERFTKFWCSHIRAHVSIPQPHGGRRYEFLLQPDEDHAEVITYQSVKNRLAPMRELVEADLIRAAVYTFHALVAKDMVVNRVMLLGDAAHMTPPFAGQGLNAGLRDALSAFWRAAWVQDGTADVSFLRSYHEERHDQCHDMINFALNLGVIMMPTDEFEERVTKRLFNLIGLIPEAKDYIYNMRFKPPNHLQDGFRTKTPGLSNDEDPCGKKLPQPVVTLQNGAEILLDELLGSGFSRVGLGLDTAGLMLQLENLPSGCFDINRVVLLLPHEQFPEGVDDSIIYAKINERYIVSKDYRYLPKPHTVVLVRPDRYCLTELDLARLNIISQRTKKLFYRMQHGWTCSD